MNARLETIIGLFVIIVAISFAVFSYKVSELKKYNTDIYKITAKFNQIEGIVEGSDIRISGINVGAVADIKLDPQTYDAVVTMAIKNDVKIPDDSSAQIVTEGLLKNKYIAIYAGAGKTMLKNNGQIKFTQSSISLENLISKLIYNFSK
ncbi:MAG: outer membrane lipid asymmetry maintenance protein MlaD [Rickettsiales bacterium]|nr:outer membrane lipid asymmetry maintenance protein MlaD [Rickettsiales bacterium]